MMNPEYVALSGPSHFFFFGRGGGAEALKNQRAEDS